MHSSDHLAALARDQLGAYRVMNGASASMARAQLKPIALGSLFVSIANDYNHSGAAGYYTQLSDEYLRTYFLLGLNQVAHYSRYHVMAHCLEVSFKASLANRSVRTSYITHNLEHLENQLVQQGDREFEQLRPERAAQEVFGRMFHRAVSTFDMQDWLNHREALEILVCYKYAADLKYGVDKKGNHLLAVVPNSGLVNMRFLRYIFLARRHFPEHRMFGNQVAEFGANLERQFPVEFKGVAALCQ